MYKSIKYRIYPNKTQVEIFNKTFGCCRKIWNLILEEKINSYKQDKTFKSRLLSSFKEEYPYLKDVDNYALFNVQTNLLKTIRATFNKKGFPKFKSNKYSRKSYTTKYYNNNIIIGDNYITLPNVGNVKAKIHKTIKDDHKIVLATISKECDGTYCCSITFECIIKIPDIEIDTSKSIGLDYASNGLYVDDNGNVGSNHKYFKESQNKLAKLQKRLAKKQGSKKGENKSNNYLKQQAKVNKLYSHIANQRNDNLHKLSSEIANHVDIVCVEDLDMISISKQHRLGKTTMDNGYDLFLRYLEYKLKNKGKKFIKVDKYFPSSQKCNNCGYINSELKDLNIREWICPICGTLHNRDINAAINIKNEGLRLYNLHLNTITVG